MKWFFALTVLFGFSLSAHAQIKVGNGGDIVHTSDGRWILADFYLNKVQQPFIGDRADLRILSRIRSSRWLGFLDVDHQMLARTLTDIEAKKPGLGYLLLEALESYKINWSEGVLPFTVAEEDLIAKLKKDGHSLQRAAARRDDWILFNWEVWNHLSAESRIGLLMHEGVFALMHFQCGSEYPVVCSQDKERAMQIVADLFTDKKALEVSELDIPEDFFSVRIPEPPTMKVYDHADTANKVLASWGEETLGSNYWPSFCQGLMVRGAVKLRTTVTQPLYIADRVPFRSPIGYQRSLKISPQPLRWERVAQVDDAASCESFFRSSQRSWRQKRAESKYFNQRGNFWWDFLAIIVQN